MPTCFDDFLQIDIVDLIVYLYCILYLPTCVYMANQSSPPTSDQLLVTGVTTMVLILGLISYILRLCARQVSGARLWYDDYIVGFALVR